MNRDPTPSTKKKISTRLLSLHKAGTLSNNLYRRLHPSASTCPKFYGLPKVHKLDVPLRPIAATKGSSTYNLAQHHDFEETALSNYHIKLKIWKRSVDDVFLIWSHGKYELDLFLQYINGLHLSINFTMETEDEQRSLPFLDVIFTRNTNGSLSHSVYRKSTHTYRYLNYRSFHHPAIKSSVCRALVQRAHSICDDESIGKELDHIKDVLKNNGFPDKQILLNAPKPKSKIDNNNTDLVKSVCLPYIGPASHRIERILRSNNIKVYHNSNQKIHQILFSHKLKTRQTRTRSQVSIVSHVNADWFTLEKPDEI